MNRRSYLRVVSASGSVAIVGGLAGCASNSGGGSKSSKEAVNYQDQPQNGQQCSGCQFFIPPEDGENAGKCSKVKGKIASEGWCQLYVPG